MWSYVINSLANLKAHKLRVSIAIFWIIVGITSVVVIGSIGNGAKKHMEQSITQMSQSNLTIEFISNDESKLEFIEFLNPITKADISDIKSVKGVKKIGSEGSSDYLSGEAKINSSMTHLEIYSFDESGNDPNKDKYEIIMGRDFTENDAEKNVIILNDNSMFEMNFPSDKLIGKAIEFKGDTYEVIGIMYAGDTVDELGFYEWNPLSYSSLMPKSTAQKVIDINSTEDPVYRSLDIELEKGYNPDEISQSIIEILSGNHPNIDGYYQKYSDGYDPSQEIDAMLSGIDKFVMLVTVISMIVGGIGVMNIMYVSVVERKREIGIRRAIGAGPRKIIGQFLIEATVITSMGCAFGLIVGSLAISYISTKMPFNAIPTISLYIQAILSSVLTGILSGVLPAIKASRIDPIDAIKG